MYFSELDVICTLSVFTLPWYLQKLSENKFCASRASVTCWLPKNSCRLVTWFLTLNDLLLSLAGRRGGSELPGRFLFLENEMCKDETWYYWLNSLCPAHWYKLTSSEWSVFLKKRLINNLEASLLLFSLIYPNLSRTQSHKTTHTGP